MWFLQRRVFGSSNSPLGTPIEPKWTRDPAIPKNAELAYLAVNLLPFFRFSHFFHKKQIAVVWSFRHLRHRSGGYLAAQRNWRQFCTFDTFSCQSAELSANFLVFFWPFRFVAKSLSTVSHFEDVLCCKCRTVFELLIKSDFFFTNFIQIDTFLIPAARGSCRFVFALALGCPPSSLRVTSLHFTSLVSLHFTLLHLPSLNSLHSTSLH